MADRSGPGDGEGKIGLVDFLRGSWLNWLLLFVPVSMVAEAFGLPGQWQFVLAALAIIPLAGLIGDATEQFAHRVGPGVGGLTSAAFGNATELIIALFALRAGLDEVVKASISGSIIGNILLVLGLSMVFGGWGRETQIFNRTRAGASSAMLFLAVVALVMPAVLELAISGNLTVRIPSLETVSFLLAIVLLGMYIASLVFSLKTHRDLITSAPAEIPSPILTMRNSVTVLLVATILVAFESEMLVGAISSAAPALGMTEFFVGVVVVAVVGNAAEHYAAILVAIKNNMELALTIATGSSTQIALFVAPVLVFASFLFGRPLSLVFNPFEIFGVTLAVLSLVIVSLDGESTWFEGLQLVAVYSVLVIVFYFVPAA